MFQQGDFVIVDDKHGCISFSVPGNGRPGEEWYNVAFDDGSEELHQSDAITLYRRPDNFGPICDFDWATL